MTGNYQYKPDIGSLKGLSFEAQTEVFLEEIFSSIKEMAEEAYNYASQVLGRALEAVDIATSSIALATQASQDATLALNTANSMASTADRALLYAEWQEKGSCSTPGAWIINNLILGKPLFVVTYAPSYPTDAIMPLHGGGPVLAFWPISTSMTIKVPNLVSGTTLRAYQ